MRPLNNGKCIGGASVVAGPVRVGRRRTLVPAMLHFRGTTFGKMASLILFSFAARAFCFLQSKMSRHASDCKVYVGDLGNNASKQELEDAFGYYGHLRNVWVARNPPGFAFVEFEDARDAEDAVRALDGRSICGRRARVELSNGKGGGGRGFRGGGGGGGGAGSGGGRGGDSGGRGGDRASRRPFHPDDRCYECGDRGHYARDCSRHGRGGGGGRSSGGGGASGKRK